jgi:predicted nucleotidyltransferase
MTTAVQSAALETLPASVRAPLAALTESLQQACGTNLAALVVYGSAARGGFVPGASDVDLVVVLKDTSIPHLLALAEPLQLARYSARVEAMILKLENIAPAADVFPLLYDDLQQRSVLLCGVDPFAGLAISDAHRRLRIEQELREARIRMRRAVVDALGSEATIDGAVARKIKQLRSPLHALLKLKGLACDDRLESVLQACAQLYGVDTAPLAAVQAAPEAAHAALRVLLDAAIADVDALESGAGR